MAAGAGGEDPQEVAENAQDWLRQHEAELAFHFSPELRAQASGENTGHVFWISRDFSCCWELLKSQANAVCLRQTAE